MHGLPLLYIHSGLDWNGNRVAGYWLAGKLAPPARVCVCIFGSVSDSDNEVEIGRFLEDGAGRMAGIVASAILYLLCPSMVFWVRLLQGPI